MPGAVVCRRKQQHGFLPWGFSCVIYPAATSRAELVDWYILPSTEPSCSSCSPAGLLSQKDLLISCSSPGCDSPVQHSVLTSAQQERTRLVPVSSLGLQWTDTVVLGYQGGISGRRLRLWEPEAVCAPGRTGDRDVWGSKHLGLVLGSQKVER